MTTLLLVLLLFLLAFLGMAAGLIIGRKGLRGGCGSTSETGGCTKSKCECSADGAK